MLSRSTFRAIGKGSFEPRLIGKGQTRIDGLDDKIVAMYARGMSVRESGG